MENCKDVPLFALPFSVERAIGLLNEHGYEAYAVGGAVRDLLRGECPHDYDITTNATPDEMKGVFSRFRTIETGIAHGTLTVILDGNPIEITTYRVDGSYTDSRHPDSVSFTRSLKEDAARRDFTVNAMAYHPKEGVIDFFGGREDLKNGTLRTVGDSRRRFTEDALRILRGLRFCAVLGYTLHKETREAIHALKDTLSLVAAERIREEFTKLITAPHAAAVLRAYADVLGVFIPEILPMIGFDQKNPHHDFDIWEHTIRAVEACPRDKALRLAVLLHDIGKPACFFEDRTGVGHFYGHAARSAEMADTVLRRLRFDNDTRERVLLLIRQHDTVPLPKTRQFARMRSRFGDAFLSDWLAVVRADRMGQKALFSPEAERILAEAEAEAKRLLAAEDRFSLDSLAIKGDELIALGYRGKAIGEAKKRALDGVVGGKVQNTKEALLMYLQKTEQEPPIECERKFLIRYPDTEVLLSLGAERSEITQTYLNAPEGTTARVRQRVFSDKTVLLYTKKTRLTALSAIEEERMISKEEYDAFLREADPTRTPVRKTRYTLPYEGHLLEIDVYPFWERQAVLEIELADEDEAYSVPPFITLLREVTADKAYKNVSLAKDVPTEEV